MIPCGYQLPHHRLLGQMKCVLDWLQTCLATGIAPAVADALDTAAAILEEAGYHVEEIEPPLIEEVDDTIQRLAETEISFGSRKYLGNDF